MAEEKIILRGATGGAALSEEEVIEDARKAFAGEAQEAEERARALADGSVPAAAPEDVEAGGDDERPEKQRELDFNDAGVAKDHGRGLV